MALNLSDVRIYVDQDTHEIYEKLVSQAEKNAESHPFRTMKDLFVIAACIGSQQNKYVPLSTQKKEIFRGSIFRDKLDVPILAAIAYHKERDLSVLEDPRKIVDIAQGWANGGIHLLQDELLYQPGTPLLNWVNMLLDRQSSYND